jgi:ABC-type multidrug transport system ATPase subunit
MKQQGVVDDRLQLLRDVTGSFRPAVLTALMGVSGAGKTTLMDVLAGRKTGGYIEGDMRISGYPKNQETFARISGYCEQNDIHSPQVTVRESLIYSAFLRLPEKIGDQEITDDIKIVSHVFFLVKTLHLFSSSGCIISHLLLFVANTKHYCQSGVLIFCEYWVVNF